MKNPDRLYHLLPAVYRERDAAVGFPLRALLQMMGESVDAVEADIARLYENWFIETCEDWVVPYVGEVVGYRLVHEAGQPGASTSPRSRARNRILAPRREVANTVAYRRRKGSLALLELLSNNVAGWPARAVEFYSLLCWTQHVNHARLDRGRTCDLSNSEALRKLGGPFERTAHTVDLRRPTSALTRGRFQVPALGLFVFRLRAYSIGWREHRVANRPRYADWSVARCLEEGDARGYTFSVLGNDTALFNRPVREKRSTQIAGELNLPVPIAREGLEVRRDTASGELQLSASEHYYGAGKSFAIAVPGWPNRDGPQPIPASRIIPANLSAWMYQVPRDHIAVDPETGRIRFPSGQLPREGVYVMYHYGFSADIGGGEYHRPVRLPQDAKIYQVRKAGGDESPIADAYRAWRESEQPSKAAVIEIMDGAVYTDRLDIDLKPGQSLQIRATNGVRPTLRFLDHASGRPDGLTIRGGAGSRFTLDGLLLSERGVTVVGPDRDEQERDNDSRGDLCDVTFRHCTFVPGWGLGQHCEPRHRAKPSIRLMNTHARLRIAHSIVGAIHVVEARREALPVEIEISDSIWDAIDENRDALHGEDCVVAPARLTVARVTVFGRIRTHELALAENVIFAGGVHVARTQTGCVRFCHVPAESRTPGRYECQPDKVTQRVTEAVRRGELPAGEAESRIGSERSRVWPQFSSVRYGTAAYAQLGEGCAPEISGGADDGAEMGVFHDLFQPQRTANLRARLAEYSPAGMDAGIIYAT
jgi:hypothetical protein